MATLLPISWASAEAPPRPNLGMSIRNIKLMFVNSQLCKNCHCHCTPKRKKHSIAAHSEKNIHGLLAMPFHTSPCNSLFNSSSLSSTCSQRMKVEFRDVIGSKPLSFKWRNTRENNNGFPNTMPIHQSSYQFLYLLLLSIPLFLSLSWQTSTQDSVSLKSHPPCKC